MRCCKLKAVTVRAVLSGRELKTTESISRSTIAMLPVVFVASCASTATVLSAGQAMIPRVFGDLLTIFL